MKVPIICRGCGTEFLTFPCRAGRAKYCSATCRKNFLALQEKKDNRLSVKCSHCGKDIKRVKVYPIKEMNHYCSTKCKAIAQSKHVKRICATCGIEFEVHPSDINKSANAGMFCSKVCRGKAMSKMQYGPNNPFWRGGVSPKNKLIRNGKRMRDWRISVFERDNYTCQICGQKGGLLHAHHIVEFHKNRENYDISNGMTVHAKCHYEGIHGYNREH